MGIHFLITSFKITFSGTEVIAQLTARAMDGHIMRCGTISCHFRDCKALLVTSLTRVSGAIASVQTFTFTFTLETRHLSHINADLSYQPKSIMFPNQLKYK